MPHARALTGPSPFLLLMVLLLAATPLSAQETSRAEGTGSWGPEGHEAPANATWLLREDHIVAYHVETANGTRATCLHGNGTLTTPEGSGDGGACGGRLHEEQANLYLETSTTRWNGTFEPEAPGGTGGAAGPTVVELVLGLVAIAAITGSGVLALLLVRERRLTGHLARRLYERSRGKRAHQHPDHLEQERVRRILVRSKN